MPAPNPVPPYVYNTVRLKVSGWDEEYIADSGPIYPGMFVQLQADGGVIPSNIMGGGSAPYIAKEDALQGHSLFDPYNIGDLVSVCIPKRGDHVLALVAPGAPAFLAEQEVVYAGDGTVRINPGAGGTGGAGMVLYANPSPSAAVTNTVVETTFNRNWTAPANFFQVGDVLHIRGVISCPSTNATDTLTVKAYMGAVVLMTTPAVDVANGDVCEFDITVEIRAVGGAGVGAIAATGTFALGTPGTAVVRDFDLAQTTIDTTIANLIRATGTWSVANAGDQAQLDIFEIELERQMNVVGKTAAAFDNSGSIYYGYVELIMN